MKDYCHPGDASFDEDSEEDSQDDRPECEFGSHCYRYDMTISERFTTHKHSYKGNKCFV